MPKALLKPSRCVQLLFVCLLFWSGVFAQTNYQEQLGPPPQGATIPVELGYINLTNGNLHLEVPLGTFRQRGALPYTAKLVYESRIWVPGLVSQTSSQITYRPSNLLFAFPAGGWRLETSNDPNFTGNYSGLDLEECDPNFYFEGQHWAQYSGFSFQEPNGATHTFGDIFTAQSFVDKQINCNPYGDIPSTSGYAVDGSGYFIQVTNYTNTAVYAPDGTQVATSGVTGTVEDSNGNYFSLDANKNVIDTLGRTPVITSTSGNQIYYDVLNAQGGRSRYTATTQSINVSVPYYSSTLTVYQSISLPNGASYQFGYDAGTSGDNWGLINSVTLPTGGKVTYGYTTFTDASGNPLLGSNRWVTSRTSGGGTWSYTPKVLSGFSGSCTSGPLKPPVQQTTVTKPDKTYEVYKFFGLPSSLATSFINSETDYYNASNNLVMQDVLDFSQDPSCTSVPPIPSLASGTSMIIRMPIRLTRIIYDAKGNSLTSKKEYDYTNSPSIFMPTKVSEWNYYSGTASTTPDRIIQAAYSITNSTYAAAHINAKPLSITLTDGSANQIAQSTYTYDDTKLVSTGTCQTSSASQASPAAPQHDYQAFCTSNTTRGNPTHVSKWLNTSSGSITTQTNTYDDTGNLITAADALGNTTTFTYSSDFGLAYITNASNALGQATKKGYDFNTGLTLSVTDPNSQITSYTYDNMGRLTETDFPDGGQTKISFSDAVPFTITSTELATPDPSIVRTTVLDGLGRTQSECTSDPQANDSKATDCVDITYDANGRVASASNPHRGTAATTDGVISYAYDALDRKTTITEQDGSTVAFSYPLQTTAPLGQSVITTDETGRVRQSITDSFSRLVEVLEPTGSTAPVTATGSGTVNGTEQSTQVLVSPATSGTGSVQFSGNIQWKTVSNASTGGTTNITITGAEQQQPVGVIAGTGSVTVSGSEQIISAVAATASISISGSLQSKQVQTQAATQATGYVSIGGSEQSVYQAGDRYCADYDINGNCVDWEMNPGNYVYDAGTVYVTVNGHSDGYNFGQNDTTSTIASGLANSINSDGSASVTARASGATVYLTSKNTGTAANMSLGSSYSYDSTDFSHSSFTTANSGSSLTGGQNAVMTTVYDSGTTTITGGGEGDASSWSGSGTTAASIASSLASSINNDSKAVFSASASGSTLSLTAKTAGAASNYSLTCSSTYNSGQFSSASFSIACPSAMSGGKDPVYDKGTVTLTVNNHSDSASWGQGDTPTSIASNLAKAINADTGASVTATASNATVNLTATTKGTISNYPMSVAVSYDTAHFNKTSFTPAASGATLTGGWPNPNAVDSGTMTVTVNSNNYKISWGQSDTPGSIANNLLTALKADPSITPTLAGATVYLDPKQAGAAYSFSTAYTYDNADFTQSSFNTANSISDYGTATVTVNGHTDSVAWAGHDTLTSITTGLLNQINGDSGAVVNGTLSGSTLSLTARATGAVTNYKLASVMPDDSAHFSADSFSSSNSGAALTGGADAVYKTVFDAGTVWVSVNGLQVSVPYQQGTTGSAIAAALANGFNSPTSGSPVTATVSGSTLNLVAIEPGAVGNYSLTSGSSTSQSSLFSQPSFSVSVSGANLSGGKDGSPGNFSTPAVTLYTYDLLNNLTCAVQKGTDATAFKDCPSSPATWRPRSFTYDSFSRLLAAKNPESGTISYSYDAGGNLLQKTSPAPNQTSSSTTQTISFCYDALNRVTGKAYSAQTCTKGQLPAGTAVVSYAYDQSSSQKVTISNGVGRLTSLTDQAGSGIYSYDSMGRMVSEKRTINPGGNLQAVSETMGYSYDLAGALTQVTYPSGAAVNYAYDAVGRALSAVDSGNKINYVTGATYGPDSSLTGFSSGSTIANNFSYNSRLQPVNISAATASQTVFSLTYDFHLGSGDNGNVFEIANGRDNARTQVFTYDGLNRLASAQNVGTDCTQNTANGLTKYWGNSYSYDVWGNLLQKAATQCKAEGLNVTADTNNRIHTLAAPDFTYDAAGNMMHDATTGNDYSYDPENRITGAAGFTYTYDADGNRVEKSTSGTSPTGTLYWYMSPGIVAESDLSGNLKSEYVFFGGRRVARKDFSGSTPAISYYFSDHLKTASVITDASGNIKEDEDYYPWGGELKFVDNDSNHYKFGGHERDTDTGLDYFGARYYGNWTGRFLNPDWAAKAAAVPYANFGNPQSLNLYSYAGNNPTTLGDPDGHEPGNSDPECVGCGSYVPRGGPCFSNGHCIIEGGGQNGQNPPLSRAARFGLWVRRMNEKIDKALAPLYQHMQNVLDLLNPCPNPEISCAVVFPTGGAGAAREVWPGPGSGPQVIRGVTYTEHALERMAPVAAGGRGIPPSVVENAIQNGVKAPGKYPGTVVHTFENVMVVTNAAADRVITVIKIGY